MEGFRRKALIVGALTVTCWACAGSAGGPAKLQLDVGGPAGSLRIVNNGAAETTILPAIKVEKKERAGWVPIATEFNATASCTAPVSAGKVSIAPRAALTVVPWRGYSCSGQCTKACRANVYYGPGVFRFVISRDAKSVETSGEFTMPAGR